MKQIVLTITAEAPLAIGQQKPGGSVSEALDYIPGSVIRGAIAAKILAQADSDPGPDEDGNEDDFHKLFLGNHAAVFQNAYPAITGFGSNECPLCNYDIGLLPATALSSKTNGGFKPGGSGVFDSLIDSYCAREYGHFYEPNDVTGDRVEPFKGFYSWHRAQEDENGQPVHLYQSHSVSKRVLTRVGINRRRATAEEQILYSIEVLNETQGKHSPQPSIYRSAILFKDDELASHLCEFIARFSTEFRLGGSTSRGLGKVHIQANLQDFSDDNLVESRIKLFNAELRKRWQLWNLFDTSKMLPEKKHFFTLNLQSDTILREDWRRTMVISEEMLRQATQVQEDGTLKLEIAYSSYDYRSGWNAAWGLEKDVELITNMAGAYLFSTESPDLWYEPLTKLEQHGVGDRTSEGFGQLKVCDEFHLIFREEPV